MSILRSLDRCTLDVDTLYQARISNIVVCVLYQVMREASTIFSEMFNQIRACCYAKRDRHKTPILMYKIADHLGEMFKEIESLDNVVKQWNYAVSMMPVPHCHN